MTADAMVDLFAAAALLIATVAHYEAVCELHRVGLDLALTAVLLAAATLVHALVPEPLAGIAAPVLFLCAQAAAAVAAWHIYRSSSEALDHELA